MTDNSLPACADVAAPAHCGNVIVLLDVVYYVLLV